MARLGTDAANTWAVMDVTNALKGQRVCVSGHLGLPRNEISDIIRKAGGTFHPSMKWDTTILVTNADWTKGTISGDKSNKLRKAEQQGVKIMSEQQFIDFICEHGQSTGNVDLI